MKRRFLLAAAALLLLIPAASQAQILTAPQNVTLNAALTETLSISLTGVSTVNFALTPGASADGDNAVGIQTSWVLKPGRTIVKLVGYFDTTSALTDVATSATIASSDVYGRVTTGSPTSYTAFTGTDAHAGTPGASLLLFNQAITGLNKNSSRTDNLDLRIDLTSTPQQPAGDYTGVLRIRAVSL